MPAFDVAGGGSADEGTDGGVPRLAEGATLLSDYTTLLGDYTEPGCAARGSWCGGATAGGVRSTGWAPTTWLI
jgi:hypothetical protein